MRIYRSKNGEKFVSVNDHGSVAFTSRRGAWIPLEEGNFNHPSNPAWNPENWDLIVGEEPKPKRFQVDQYGSQSYGMDPLCGWRVVDWRASGPEQILAVYPTEVEAQKVCDTLNAHANVEKG